MSNIEDKAIAIFEGYQIRRQYDEENEVWYFSVIDILNVLLQNSEYQTSRKYWNKLKERLKKHNEGGSIHTAKYKPWKLIVYLGFQDKCKAMAFETYLKTGSGYSFSKNRFW